MLTHKELLGQEIQFTRNDIRDFVEGCIDYLLAESKKGYRARERTKNAYQALAERVVRRS